MFRPLQVGVLMLAVSGFGVMLHPASSAAEEPVVRRDHHGDSHHGHVIERHEKEVHHGSGRHHGDHHEVVRERGHSEDKHH